jgi:DNA polymerase III subunit beta
MNENQISQSVGSVKVDNKALFNAIKLVAPIAEKRGCLPILSHILVSANGRLEFTATDLNVGIRTWIDVQSEEEFSLCVPASRFKDIAGNLAGEVELTKLENSFGFKALKITSAGGNNELSTMDAEDYPVWVEGPGLGVTRTWAEVATVEFLDQMKQADRAASHDNSRFNLNTIYLDGPNGCLVATDGDRALKQEVNWIPEAVKALIPVKAMKSAVTALVKIKKQAGLLELIFTEKHLYIKTSMAEFTIRLTEGDYPDYRKVIPQTNENSAIILDAAKLKKGLKLVKLMSNKRHMAVELYFDDLSDAMKLRCQNEDQEYGQTWVPATFRSFAPQTPLLLNVQYLMDAVNKCKDTNIPLYLNEDPYGPVMIGQEILMPMRK